MKKLAAFVTISGLLVPTLSFAQEGDDVPSSPPLAATTTSASSPCRLGDHDGFAEADARTAAQVVCAEIGRAGASPGTHYRISLGKLGTIAILSVAREGDTPGTTVDSREMRLQSVEEVMVAAPRIAESIVKGTPLGETEKVDNLVGQETRQPKSKPGKTHFALGLVGLLAPLDQGIAPAPGIVFDVHYETGSQQIELGGSLRFGGGDGSGSAAVSNGFFFFFSLGGRAYTSDAEISPYFGGGLSWSFLSLHAPGIGVEASGNGLGAYADAGVEILRTHHAHLSFGVRLDLPFFALTNSYYSYPTTACPVGGAPCNTTSPTPQPSTFYYVPVSLELRMTF